MLGKVTLVSVVASLGLATVAWSADMPAPYDPPPSVPISIQSEAESGGWYLRGDINHHWTKFRGATYITYGTDQVEPGTNGFTWGKFDSAWSLGGGLGYQINRHLHTDLTFDYWFKSSFRGSTSGECGGQPCVSDDRSSYKALLLLANAYVDLGTYNGVTPYVGAGIGGSYVRWSDLINDIDTGSFRHRGGKGWRFAWALMAGASVCLTDSLELDAGYRFTHIHGGRMFGYADLAGPGYDRGFNVHEARAGLRYSFSGPSLHCAPQQQPAFEQVSYEPAVYKP